MFENVFKLLKIKNINFYIFDTRVGLHNSLSRIEPKNLPGGAKKINYCPPLTKILYTPLNLVHCVN